MTGQEILDLPMEVNDADAKTVRDYLKALLITLWHEGEGFSGKRPFGNSGWDNDLLQAVSEIEPDEEERFALILDAIEAL